MKSFQAALDPGVLFKLKNKDDQRMIDGVLSNYGRSNFLSYFPLRVTFCKTETPEIHDPHRFP